MPGGPDRRVRRPRRESLRAKFVGQSIPAGPPPTTGTCVPAVLSDMLRSGAAPHITAWPPPDCRAHIMVDPDLLARHLDLVLDDATLPELPNHYRGKVRDNYNLLDGRRIIIATDRLSAFDRILTAIPCKGQVLTQIARFWFNATSDICPNHVIEYPDPNVLVCRRLEILPVEVVVRDYLTGTTGTSIWPMYKAGRRELYGIRFPDGLRENQKLPSTIVTPTTKAFDGSHDEPLTPGEIMGRGLLTSEQWQTVAALALALFARGREIASQHGLILVDTKYEFGFDEEGRIILADRS